MPANHGLYRREPPDGQPPEDVGVFRFGILGVFWALASGAFLSDAGRARAVELNYHFGRVSERFVFGLQELSFSMRRMSTLFSQPPMSPDFSTLAHQTGMQAEYAMSCLGTLVDDIAVAIVLATGLPDSTDSMSSLRRQHARPILAPVAPLLRELMPPTPTSWWALAFKRKQGARQLLVHNQHLIQFHGVGSVDGPFDAQANLVSPTGQTPLPTSDVFVLLRDILLDLCGWLDRLEIALRNHLAPRDAAYQWPPRCKLIMLPVGYPPGPTTLESDYFPLPMCDGSDPLPWTIRWHRGPRRGNAGLGARRVFSIAPRRVGGERIITTGNKSK
jgi:hypothetical protein